jgi:hypothetical protein
MTCKGICIQYKTGKNPDGSRYGNGKKRCQVCEIFIKCNSCFCPCCGYRLRIRSRNKGSKERMREREK